ncbi:uncharacterized protein SRS1_17412 [Sporisorium reilianum f. sp. reilianum]|uniref:Uncharacterized protein n=1 Tax=Sporisorium reilianum f. sp. reilianum TaxID=72559 RepID=A0A2N8UCF3_9BASI|nr:uncharacterized protein SRS1_17412 [Sporisorium reilianum f. sp. reilianum]
MESQSSILNLEWDSHSAELLCYADNQATADASGAESPSNTHDTESESTTPVSTLIRAGPAHHRGANWSGIDHLCFITPLDNHNPWITPSSNDALAAWTEAINETNLALQDNKRQAHNHGAFEAQWRKMVKDVRDQKQLQLKATGANFDKEEGYQLLYNLVNLYNTSPFKLAFLKPQDNTPPSSSQVDCHLCQKRKAAVSAACLAGLTGQTLACQRMRDRQVSISSSDTVDNESQETLGDQEEDNPTSAQATPTQKQRKTPKMQIGELLVNGLNKLINLQASSLSRENNQGLGFSHSLQEQEVASIKSQVSQLQSNMTGINQKMDTVLHLLMQQQSSDHFP